MSRRRYGYPRGTRTPTPFNITVFLLLAACLGVAAAVLPSLLLGS